MKFAVKSLVIAAAFVAAGSASAQNTTLTAGNSSSTWNGYYIVEGSGTLSFDNYDATTGGIEGSMVDVLNTGNVAVSAYGAAQPTITGDVGYYTAVSVAAPFAQLTVDASGNAKSIATSGGATQVAQFVKGISGGGTVSVYNLTVDLATKTIYADIVGQTASTATVAGSVNQKQVAAFTFTGITGPTQFSGEGTYSNTLSGLVMTKAAVDYIKTALDLKTNGYNAFSYAALGDFGGLTSSFKVAKATAAVPEPSTYALMGIGLVGIGLVSRRRAASK